MNPWVSHDKCFSVLNNAGIYVIIDINTPQVSINRDSPASSYNKDYLNHVFGVVDAFKGYPNLLGFFAGNEVINDGHSASVSPPYIRAVIRDIKQYISIHANRTIPVGYSAADEASLRFATLMYLECESKEGDFASVDFYGLNSYAWCSGRGDTWESSGYGSLLDTFKNSSIPVFFSEYGCNVDSPRSFNEVYDGVYAKLATVFSGGLVYEYAQEANDYGLVELNSDGSARVLDDFANLQKAYNKINLTVEYENSISNASRPTCSSSFAKTIQGLASDFNTTFTLPPCPASDLLKNGGGNKNVGKLVDLSSVSTNHKIYNINGEAIENTTVVFSPNNQINSPSGSSVEDSKTNSSETISVSSSASATSTASTQETKSTSTSKAGASVLSSATGALALVFGFVFAVL